MMLRSQLDELLKIKPDLLTNDNFVGTYIRKLTPSPDVDWRNDAKEKEAYLDRLWSFVDRLPPAQNSLKAHVLYYRLEFDRSRGEHNKARFMEYIRLPRQVHYANPKYLNQWQNPRICANLKRNYEDRTNFPPVRNDESLVRDYPAIFPRTGG